MLLHVTYFSNSDLLKFFKVRKFVDARPLLHGIEI